ncbi:MAG: tetratricopeptide repeat protein, partial [Myxococcales bacterium]|nr:tetratricopeptide repeat protein [Myxococcales bacterium]
QPGPNRRASSWRVLSLALALSLAAAPAVGAETAEERDTRIAKAQAYLDLATTLFKAQDYEGALKELQRAEPLLDGSDTQPLVRFNIARCLEELGRPADAVRAYQRYLALSEGADKRRDRAREAIALLEPRAIGRLAIDCAQPGTVVRLPTVDQTAHDCPYKDDHILAGAYEIVASRPGYRDERRSVTVAAGEDSKVRFVLAVADADVPEPETVKAGTTTRSTLLPWAVVGAGASVLAVGGVFNALAAGTRDEVLNAPPSDERDADFDSFETQRTAAVASYIGGAALLGVGIYLVVDAYSDHGAATGRVVPTGDGVMVRF